MSATTGPLRQNCESVSFFTITPVRVCTTMPAFDAATMCCRPTAPLESAGESVPELSATNDVATGGAAIVATAETRAFVARGASISPRLAKSVRPRRGSLS
jgi:hypothetical protein